MKVGHGVCHGEAEHQVAVVARKPGLGRNKSVRVETSAGRDHRSIIIECAGQPKVESKKVFTPDGKHKHRARPASRSSDGAGCNLHGKE